MMTDLTNIKVIITYKLILGFIFAYLHFTLTLPIGQGEGYAKFSVNILEIVLYVKNCTTFKQQRVTDIDHLQRSGSRS